MEGIRINKFISDSGFCSRREADKMIEELDVEINGKVASTGDYVYPGDKVKAAGQYIKNDISDRKRIYIAFNKPVGVVSTTDPTEKNNIVNYINHKERIFNIGRLDKMSEGLIFLTNDGDIVNKILRSDNNHEKEYVVTVDKPIDEEFINRMSNGIRIMDGSNPVWTNPCKVVQLKEDAFRIVLTQGLNRQIRKMCSKLGYKVTKLKRVRIMNISLGSLKTGGWREFTEKELAEIQTLTKTSTKIQSSKSTAAPKKRSTPAPKSTTPPKKKTTASRSGFNKGGNKSSKPSRSRR